MSILHSADLEKGTVILITIVLETSNVAITTAEGQHLIQQTIAATIQVKTGTWHFLWNLFKNRFKNYNF